jgi:hypothetical protein
MLRCVALVRTGFSEELGASIIRVTRIGELGTALAVTSNPRTLRKNTKWAHWVFLRRVRRLLVTASVVPSSPILVTLMMEAIGFFETPVHTRATRRNIAEDAILDSCKFFTSAPWGYRINYIQLPCVSIVQRANTAYMSDCSGSYLSSQLVWICQSKVLKPPSKREQ